MRPIARSIDSTHARATARPPYPAAVDVRRRSKGAPINENLLGFREFVACGPMTYVIVGSCIKDDSCIEVCPVDCIHPKPGAPDFETAEQLYIDPTECIDCDACVEACPVDACFAEDQLPDEWTKFTEINVQYFKNQGA